MSWKKLLDSHTSAANCGQSGQLPDLSLVFCISGTWTGGSGLWPKVTLRWFTCIAGFQERAEGMLALDLSPGIGTLLFLTNSVGQGKQLE